MTETEPISSDTPLEIVARRGTYYRNTRILVGGMLLVMGCWFLYDGLAGYPSYNERFEKSTPSQQFLMQKPHSDSDIQLQRGLGIALLPLGLVLSIWFWYASRGAYRLVGETLSIPGHPPIAFSAITEIDKSKWERKGIAYVSYQLPDGNTGRFKLDDFVYDRKPIDAILERIEVVTRIQGATEEEASPEDSEGV